MLDSIRLYFKDHFGMPERHLLLELALWFILFPLLFPFIIEFLRAVLDLGAPYERYCLWVESLFSSTQC